MISSRQLRTPRRLFTAAAFALLAATGVRPAVAVAPPDLTVDTANGNSPYPITSNQTVGAVIVGNTGVGVLNHSAGTLTITAANALLVGNTAGSNGTYNLSSTGAVTLTNSVDLVVGNDGTGSFVQGGSSTVNFPNSNVTLGNSSTGVGSYTLGGNASLTASALTVGTTAPATIPLP